MEDHLISLGLSRGCYTVFKLFTGGSSTLVDLIGVDMSDTEWNELLDKNPSRGRKDFLRECRFFFLTLFALFLIGFLIWLEMQYEMISGILL